MAIERRDARLRDDAHNWASSGVEHSLPTGGGYREMGVLVIYELTDADGCFPTFTQLCRGGWTLTNIFFFTQIKPGVMEVYYV